MTIPDGLIRSLAIQMFFNRNRNTDVLEPAPYPPNFELDQKWRDDILLWNNLPDQDKQLWYDRSSKYIDDWSQRYVNSVDILLNGWIEVEFNP